MPVVLLGTFGVLAAFGYSINTLTMFGMVLAIGLLVDDAIVVVENVERVMHEEGLSPKEATRKSMEQITGALVGIALVLSAVFVPMAFFGGSVGVIYRQFSITLVSAMALSVLVALVAHAGAVRDDPEARRTARKRRGFFGAVQPRLRRDAARLRAASSACLVRRRCAAMIVYVVHRRRARAAVRAACRPASCPRRTRASSTSQVLLPPGATQEQTRAVMERVEEHLLTQGEGRRRVVMAITGFGFGGRGQNSASPSSSSSHWDERAGRDAQGARRSPRARRARSRRSRTRMVFAFAPPAITELGNVGRLPAAAAGPRRPRATRR